MNERFTVVTASSDHRLVVRRSPIVGRAFAPRGRKRSLLLRKDGGAARILNRGWRFCRFGGVGHRVVSCWSLVVPATPFYLVFGPYWTTFGLRRLMGLRPCPGSPDPTRSPPAHERRAWRRAATPQPQDATHLHLNAASAMNLGRPARSSEVASRRRMIKLRSPHRTVPPPGRLMRS